MRELDMKDARIALREAEEAMRLLARAIAEALEPLAQAISEFVETVLMSFAEFAANLSIELEKLTPKPQRESIWRRAFHCVGRWIRRLWRGET